MTRKLMNRRDADNSARRGFKGKMAALLASAAMGLPACGDTIHNHYYETDSGTPTVNVEAPEVTVNMPADSTETSPLCEADGLAPAYEATINVGEAALLRNGYRLELTDLEPETQTAFFHLTDDDGAVLAHVDMVEGVEGRIDLGDGEAAIVACSVRAGYSFGERSVTLRSDSNLSREEPDCGLEEFDTGLRRTLENDIVQDVRQVIQTDTCEDGAPVTLLSETTTLEPGLEAGEGREGLAVNARLTVNVCSEMYTILDVRADGIDLGKEAVAFEMRPDADAVISPEVTLRMEGVEDHDGVDHVVISVLDSFGEASTRFHFAAGQSMSLGIEGSVYTFHAYEVRPGDGEVSASALLALISDSVSLAEGLATELSCGAYGGGNYSFSMGWAGGALSGWTLTRE
jgi:hypothetical protein